MALITKLLNNGSIAFELGNDYLIVKQVSNRDDASTNGSNNVGWWVVKGTTRTRSIGTESNDLAHLLSQFIAATKEK